MPDNGDPVLQPVVPAGQGEQGRHQFRAQFGPFLLYGLVASLSRGHF